MDTAAKTLEQRADHEQRDQPHATPEPSPPRWLTQEWLEPRLVIVTLLAIIASFIGARAGASDGLVLVLNITSYVAGGFFGAKTAVESLLERRIDVDMLMILAALGAALIGQWNEGAILLFLFSLSNVLQNYAIGRSRQAIRSLLKLYPSEATVRRDGVEQVVQINDIRVGEIVLIKPGERIPVDGIVRAGRSACDESPITGESMPVEKTAHDQVFAGTLNQQGLLDVEATQPASDTVLARIIKLVEDAQESKAPTERFLDKFEQYYATGIIAAIALIIVIPPLLGTTDFESNFYRAMVLMTVASPCALIISTPASFISAIAAGARGGVLFKGSAYLEGLAEVKAVAFDKTGTLTYGKPAVTEAISCCEMNEDELLTVAAAVESRSEHPLATAIVAAARERGLPVGSVDEFEAFPGQGIAAKLDGRTVRLGSIRYLEEKNPMPPQLADDLERLELAGQTVIGVVRDGECADCNACGFADRQCDWLGVIAMADQLRPQAKAMVTTLRAQGLEVAMLTGDNPRVAQSIAEQVGIDRVHAGLMPADKVTTVQALDEEFGAVAMIGDGVNDAPALATASVGVAMGVAGTDVALETADVVLMGDKLELIPYAINLSTKARRVVYQNLAFSVAVIILLVSGALFIDLPLPLGVLGHEGSTVIVVLNGLIALLLWPELQRRRRGERPAGAAAA
ncbi:MAG: cadmium-translocating P-type ATPase [Chloroflexi bacterium]|nr:cadmium-translocating P-type ATPase [Chloroflexota bacterium]